MDVNVERPINDPTYPDAITGQRGFYLDAGRQHLDGTTALGYARSRMGEGESDFTRAERQQVLLTAIAEKLTAGNLLVTLPGLLDAVRDNVATDIPPGRIPDLAAEVQDAELGDLEQVVLGPPDYVVAETDTAAGYILVPIFDAISRLGDRIFDGSAWTRARARAPVHRSPRSAPPPGSAPGIRPDLLKRLVDGVSRPPAGQSAKPPDVPDDPRGVIGSNAARIDLDPDLLAADRNQAPRPARQSRRRYRWRRSRAHPCGHPRPAAGTRGRRRARRRSRGPAPDCQHAGSARPRPSSISRSCRANEATANASRWPAPMWLNERVAMTERRARARTSARSTPATPSSPRRGSPAEAAFPR